MTRSVFPAAATTDDWTVGIITIVWKLLFSPSHIYPSRPIVAMLCPRIPPVLNGVSALKPPDTHLPTHPPPTFPPIKRMAPQPRKAMTDEEPHMAPPDPSV
ncbi:hypothetical protein N7447_003756 [Penicillium robsamsonii]|uniref:uncharacterized protein n=1 Tax=Penicillium robsamsonii TaxID=1792511 RepID=UPI002547DE84|nr:uncharacterized protein N7447_003756 [Penicillium robsamsonii]KAJ5826993.1 hypothetical protein N7447_003756 [Penicillium robsamsonii]